MGRPKQFDRDAALRKAIPVFWEKGFAAASADDLTSAMGIGRQSLYDTFGDKRRLYLEALGRYNTDSVGDLLERLIRAASPLAGIEAALRSVAHQPPELARLGCMGINAICEFGNADGEVSALRATSGARLDAGLQASVRAGQAAGEIGSDLDPRAAARFIGAAYAGLKVQAKAGAPAAMLDDVVALTVRALKAP